MCMKYRSNEWPTMYSDKIIIGNLKSNVAVTTLWTVREKVADILDSNDFCLVANFYDAFNGIEPLIRNCLANTNIRYILVVGNDRAKSKKTLINFFKSELKNHIVTDTEVPLPEEIPLDELNKLIRNVQVIDLTDKITKIDDFDQYKTVIYDCIKTLSKLEPYDEAKIFPKKKIVSSCLPSGVVYRIEADYIFEGWLKILKHINTFGKLTQTTQSEFSKVKECINIVTVINKENPLNPIIKDFMRFDKDNLERYYETFTKNIKSDDVSYTYGTKFFGNKQFDRVIEMLVENIYSKRCFTTTWEIGDLYKQNPPCVISAQPNIQGNQLFMTCYIRSNDMYRAWPLNAFGLRMIQKNVCVELNRRINEEILRENNDNCKFGCKIDTKEEMVEMGSLIIISHSAHIYNENFKDVELIIKDHYKFTPCYDDPNGYYTISLNKDLIVIQHYDIKGKLMREVTGCDYNELSTKLVENLLTDDKFHLMYLGREIFKADFCLKHGIEYVQDLEL